MTDLDGSPMIVLSANEAWTIYATLRELYDTTGFLLHHEHSVVHKIAEALNLPYVGE